MNVTVDEQSAVGIAEYDLCRLLHNLIDNSINAAEKCETDKKSVISIQIENDYVSITTENSFDKSEKQKKNDKDHGYGLTIVKEICKKYSGDYSFHADDKIYYSTTKIKNIAIE